MDTKSRSLYSWLQVAVKVPPKSAAAFHLTPDPCQKVDAPLLGRPDQAREWTGPRGWRVGAPAAALGAERLRGAPGTPGDPRSARARTLSRVKGWVAQTHPLVVMSAPRRRPRFGARLLGRRRSTDSAPATRRSWGESQGWWFEPASELKALPCLAACLPASDERADEFLLTRTPSAREAVHLRRRMHCCHLGDADLSRKRHVRTDAYIDYGLSSCHKILNTMCFLFIDLMLLNFQVFIIFQFFPVIYGVSIIKYLFTLK